MRVLFIEDEKKMAAALEEGLEAENHSVSLAFDRHSGLKLASTLDRDVVRPEPHEQDSNVTGLFQTTS